MHNSVLRTGHRAAEQQGWAQQARALTKASASGSAIAARRGRGVDALKRGGGMSGSNKR